MSPQNICLYVWLTGCGLFIFLLYIYCIFWLTTMALIFYAIFYAILFFFSVGLGKEL